MKSSYCIYKIKVSNFLLPHEKLFYFKIQRHRAQTSQLQWHYKGIQAVLHTYTLGSGMASELSSFSYWERSVSVG